MTTSLPRERGGTPASTEQEWQPSGQSLREVAVQPRILLDSGTSFAITTVLGAP
jgi:hypothetical protein